MPRLVVVVFREFGMVVGLDIVSHFRPLDGLLRQFTVPEIVAISKVTLVLRLALLCVWDGEEGLTNIILALHLLLREPCSGHAEEPRIVNLQTSGSQRHHGQLRLGYHNVRTASRSSSASFCLPPGESNVDKSRTLISAHGSSWDVLAGRCHLGKGSASAGLSAMGMVGFQLLSSGRTGWDSAQRLGGLVRPVIR